MSDQKQSGTMEGEIPEALPEELSAWLGERAEETGRDREEVLSRAVAAYRLMSEHEGSLPETADVDARLEEIDVRIEDLEGEVEGAKSDVDEKVSDVRERVIEVMKTARSKADPDHTHGDLEGELDDVADELAALREELSALESTVDGGFDNFEAILTDLSDSTDELDEKATKLAHAVVSLRTRLNDLQAEDARRTAVEDLQAEANRKGVATAACEDCGAKVQVGLLSTPGCPHCGSVFDGVDGSGGFLSSPTLTVGERPALEGERDEEPDPEELFDDV